MVGSIVSNFLGFFLYLQGPLGALQRKKFHTSKITMEVGVFCLYIDCTLLKVFRYYDLSVLFMSVMGFPKKVWIGLSSPGLFWIFGIFLTLQSP